MRLKTALKLSIVVNAVFMAVFGYLLATDVKLETGPLIIYGASAPQTTLSSVAIVPE